MNSEWHCTVVVYCLWENDDVGLHVLGCRVDILGTNSFVVVVKFRRQAKCPGGVYAPFIACMPGVSYCRRLQSLLLCFCDVF